MMSTNVIVKGETPVETIMRMMINIDSLDLDTTVQEINNTTIINKKKKPLPKIPVSSNQYVMKPHFNNQPYYMEQGWKTNRKISRSESLKIETYLVPFTKGQFPLETHLEKPFEPQQKQLYRKASKEEMDPSILLQKLLVQQQKQDQDQDTDTSISTPSTSPNSYDRHFLVKEELVDQSFSASEKDFQPVSPASRIPSPWGTSTRQSINRISTRFIPSVTVQTAVLPELPTTTASVDKFSIASCSLINIRSNIKLYRRLAIKTRDKEIQMTYAKYLFQISKLYDEKCHLNKKKKLLQESSAETRHRLLTEAGYWIEKLAKHGHPEALLVKGQWYLLGPQATDCVLDGYHKVQEHKAYKCFLKASKLNCAEAHYELAHVYKKQGKYAKAVRTYEKGAKQQHTLSIYKMANILLRGQLKQQRDIPRGLKYLKQAADMNDEASAEPAFVLGCVYANEFERIGIQRNSDEEKADYSMALKYLKQSAHHGYSDAIYFMGQVSETGMLSQLSDCWQAYQHYMKAAELNHAGAMLDLSRLYSRGIPGHLASQNDMAFKWCKRSAELGFDQGEYVLGKYYEDGTGVTPDFALALEYYGKAASKGYQPAAEKLNGPLADGSRRRKPKELEQYLSKAVSEPKVKGDDDDDLEHGKKGVCQIQ